MCNNIFGVSVLFVIKILLYMLKYGVCFIQFVVYFVFCNIYSFLLSDVCKEC